MNRVDGSTVVSKNALRRYVESELQRYRSAGQSDYYTGAIAALTLLQGRFLLTPDEEFEVGKTRREMMGYE